MPDPRPVADDARPVKRFGARWLALVAAVVIALYLCWQMAEPFVEVILWAGVLAVLFHPLHKRFVEQTGRPAASAALSCLVVCLTIIIPLTLVALAIAREGHDAADRLQAQVDALLDPDSRAMQWVGRYVPIDPLRARAAAGKNLQKLGGLVASRGVGAVGEVVGRALGLVLKIFFTLFTLFYLFRDAPLVTAAVRDAMPLDPAQADRVFRRTREVISASVNGVLIIAAVQGTLGGIAFALLGLPSPVVWGAVMVVLAMIPMAGTAVVWAPAAIYLFATGHWAKGTFLLVWGAVVIGMIDNLLRPKLVGEKTRLHELIIFFSVLGGLQVFGVLGLVVGPVVVAITLALLEIMRQAERPGGPREPTVMDRQDPHLPPPDPLPDFAPAVSPAADPAPAERLPPSPLSSAPTLP